MYPSIALVKEGKGAEYMSERTIFPNDGYHKNPHNVRREGQRGVVSSGQSEGDRIAEIAGLHPKAQQGRQRLEKPR